MIRDAVGLRRTVDLPEVSRSEPSRLPPPLDARVALWRGLLEDPCDGTPEPVAVRSHLAERRLCQDAPSGWCVGPALLPACALAPVLDDVRPRLPYDVAVCVEGFGRPLGEVRHQIGVVERALRSRRFWVTRVEVDAEPAVRRRVVSQLLALDASELEIAVPIRSGEDRAEVLDLRASSTRVGAIVTGDTIAPGSLEDLRWCLDQGVPCTIVAGSGRPDPGRVERVVGPAMLYAQGGIDVVEMWAIASGRAAAVDIEPSGLHWRGAAVSAAEVAVLRERCLRAWRWRAGRRGASERRPVRV